MRVGPVAPRTRDCGDCRSWRRGRIKNNAHRARLLARPTYADAFSHRPFKHGAIRSPPPFLRRPSGEGRHAISIVDTTAVNTRVAQPYRRHERSVRVRCRHDTSYAATRFWIDRLTACAHDQRRYAPLRLLDNIIILYIMRYVQKKKINK